MTDRQGKIVVATFMTVTLSAVVAGPVLAILLQNPAWMLLCFAIVFYL